MGRTLLCFTRYDEPEIKVTRCTSYEKAYQMMQSETKEAIKTTLYNVEEFEEQHWLETNDSYATLEIDDHQRSWQIFNSVSLPYEAESICTALIKTNTADMDFTALYFTDERAAKEEMIREIHLHTGIPENIELTGDLDVIKTFWIHDQKDFGLDQNSAWVTDDKEDVRYLFQLVQDPFRISVSEKALKEAKFAKSLGISPLRLSQIRESHGNELSDTEIRELVKECTPDALNRGYDVFNTGVVEEICVIGDIASDSRDDAWATARAIIDGVKIIPVEELPEGLPKERKYLGYIDTPANRKALNTLVAEKKKQLSR